MKIIIIDIIAGLLLIFLIYYLSKKYNIKRKELLLLKHEISSRKYTILEQKEFFENVQMSKEIDEKRGDTEMLILENKRKKEKLTELLEKRKNK